MIYNDFCGERVSRLGFGTMRLPLNEDKSINEEETAKMIDYALSNGINYFDTAFPYHAGKSEIVVGKILKNYPRDSFFLASKYPGHQIADEYHPDEIFEEQLKKCGVDYFDFYLLHNVCESDVDVYEDPKWGIIDYFVKQKELGRIKHLGFSSHARVDVLDEFLSRHKDELEFCQIQFNYLDYSLQEANKKYDLLTNKYHLPIVVMEPIRGGKLANVDDVRLKKLTSGSMASLALAYVKSFDNCRVILSGMSNFEQMVDNVETFKDDSRLSEADINVLYDVAEDMKAAIPCTACGYCKAGCPMGLDIPLLIASYNDMKFSGGTTIPMFMDSFSEDKKPSACIACGQCVGICPQKIDVPNILSDFNDLLVKSPKWSDISKQRALEAMENRNNG